MKITGHTYHNRVEAQIRAWVLGFAIHNDQDEECCPDFSCCEPHLFIRDSTVREKRLLSFLHNSTVNFHG